MLSTRNVHEQKKRTPKKVLTGLVQGLYTATFPSFPPSSARLSLSLFSVHMTLARAQRTRSKFNLNLVCKVALLYRLPPLPSPPPRGTGLTQGVLAHYSIYFSLLLFYNTHYISINTEKFTFKKRPLMVLVTYIQFNY